MSRVSWLPVLGLVGFLAMASSAYGQTGPYIGFVYPAGGQQGTTVQIHLGGQRIDGTSGAVVTGEGVSARLVKYYRYLNNQEVSLLREQMRILRREAAAEAKARSRGRGRRKAAPKPTPETRKRQELIDRIQARMTLWTNRPACRALSSIALVEVSIEPDAEPGSREIRLITQRGMTNPMPFHVGQVPEVARRPMKTSLMQVLGKEAAAQRKRPPEEEEARVVIPCTMNGQIASGEVNRYRFDARKGQRLVVSVDARSLVPYIADAVPGWFQPVVAVHDEAGKEVAYGDDFRFKPDPTFCFEAPKDGQYVLSIHDALFRGREDFVYRVTVGELPTVTSVFPLGRRAGESVDVEMDGWHLENVRLLAPPEDAEAGLHWVAAARDGLVSNRVPFIVDALPECFDVESNNAPSAAQKVALPTIVNGRIDRVDDWDVFQIDGTAGQTLVAEVLARRLDSPMDSMLKITDSRGDLIALNDDHEDPGVGLNTHHADSYLMVDLPADGRYYVHVGDTTRSGGEAYAYRLRLSPPRPDFALRATPSGGGLRSKGYAAVTVYAIRKDGFEGEIHLNLKGPSRDFLAREVTLKKGAETAKFGLRTTLQKTDRPVNLAIEGRARIGGREVVHDVVPAEDRMQAFLWRHLLPAEDFSVIVHDPSYEPPPKRIPKALKKKVEPPADAPKFSKRQVAGRLRQLKGLFEEWLLTDEFHNEKVAECEAAL